MILEDVFAGRDGSRGEQSGGGIGRDADAVGDEWRIDVLDAEAVPVFSPEKIATCVPVVGEIVFEVEVADEGGLRSERRRELFYGADLN